MIYSPFGEGTFDSVWESMNAAATSVHHIGVNVGIQKLTCHHTFLHPLVLLALVALSYAFIAAAMTVSRIFCAESGGSGEVS